MSDTSPDPGWWLASDETSYPPEQHPDYRPPAAGAVRVPTAAPTDANITRSRWTVTPWSIVAQPPTYFRILMSFVVATFLGDVEVWGHGPRVEIVRDSHWTHVVFEAKSFRQARRECRRLRAELTAIGSDRWCARHEIPDAFLVA